MLVLNRFRVPSAEAESFLADLRRARDVLAGQAGFREATIGRSVDEPELWVLQTSWVDVGSYRRALSANDVKLHAWAVLGRAISEASAFEVAVDGGHDLNRVEPRSLG